MADKNLKTPENIPGKFYVDSTCIDCGLCPDTAPMIFKRFDEGGLKKKQPSEPRPPGPFGALFPKGGFVVVRPVNDAPASVGKGQEVRFAEGGKAVKSVEYEGSVLGGRGVVQQSVEGIPQRSTDGRRREGPESPRGSPAGKRPEFVAAPGQERAA